jgi:hypothetical protein
MAAEAEGDGSGTLIPTPQLSDHALERYDQRAPADAVSPEAALADATPDDGIVAHPRFGSIDHPQPDRVWVYTGIVSGRLWTMTFVEIDGSVVTCWRADREDWPHIRAYLVMRGIGGLNR